MKVIAMGRNHSRTADSGKGGRWGPDVESALITRQTARQARLVGGFHLGGSPTVRDAMEILRRFVNRWIAWLSHTDGIAVKKIMRMQIGSKGMFIVQ